MNRICLAVLLTFFSAGASQATELRVAVASNFASTAKKLGQIYQQQTGQSVTFLVGSTGKHASQIQHGLDVDVFLAADVARPRLLEKRGLAISNSRFTYALGQLVLWSANPTLVDTDGEVLSSAVFERLAVANVKTAPYGRAALETLDTLGIDDINRPKLVYGESVAQAFQFINSGNAELGFVAQSQIKSSVGGSYWLVPQNMHSPIKQQAVLIKDNKAARAFFDFLRSDVALNVIQASGYLRP